MTHHPHHHHHHDMSQRRLLIATLLNFIIALAEVTGGIISNSLSLLSDAVHNLGDAFAVFIAYIARRIGKKQPDAKRTFGFRRVEILGALLNAVILIVITVYLFYEAYHRFQDPEPIKGAIMFIVAVIGLIANIAAVVLLRNDQRNSLNIRAAYIHLIGDSLSSVAVIIGSVFIYFFDAYWIDPFITVLIGLYIMKHTWRILRQTIDILMQATPEGLDLEQVCRDIEHMDEVANVHHVHAWNLTDSQVHFECHLDLKEDIRISESEKIRKKIEKMLHSRYTIDHFTIQFEHNTACDKHMIFNGKH